MGGGVLEGDDEAGGGASGGGGGGGALLFPEAGFGVGDGLFHIFSELFFNFPSLDLFCTSFSIMIMLYGFSWLIFSWSASPAILPDSVRSTSPRGTYIAGVSILTGTAITIFMLVILRVFPFTPRYIIPVAGMMVGNAMTVVGVTMKKLHDDIKIQLSLVETALALGATPRQATLQQVKRAFVLGLSPVLDHTKTVGLISLPGAMTGLIMGGASPLEAIQLQIVVMNMIVGATTVSSIMSMYLSWPSFFTKAHQLETEVFSAD